MDIIPVMDIIGSDQKLVRPDRIDRWPFLLSRLSKREHHSASIYLVWFVGNQDLASRFWTPAVQG